MARVTLADVARRANVSSATASHVLNRRDTGEGTIRVSSSTSATVRRAAAELGYVPSTTARGLASGSVGRIAIVVPNLFQPYFARIAGALIDALEDQGLSTTLRLSHDGPAERAAVLGHSTRDADGVIVCPHFLSAELLGGARPPFPVVQVGGGTTPGIDCVVMNEYEGALAAIRHLIEIGRRRVVFVADPWLTRSDSGRFLAYRDGLEEAGLPFDARLVVEGADWDRRESGLEATVGLLRTGLPFDAAMCANDALAVGALRALSSAGLRIPADIAVTGFDNTEEAAFNTPSLTSVDPGVDRMAQVGVQMLVARLHGHQGPSRRETVTTKLVVRASTTA